MAPMEERAVFVSGGSRGLGAGICRAMAAAGWRVAVGYRGEKDLAEAVAADCPNSICVQMDQSDDSSVRAALQAAEAGIGAIDALVNNAAVAQEIPFEELSDEDWERMLSVNLLGPVRAIRAVLPSMRERGFGRIVNVSSIGGQWGGVNQVHYAASKAALINLTRSMARLYSKFGITCNAIAPGLIATDMSAAELATEAGRKKLAGIPAQRLGRVEEVGAAALYLCSPQAAYLTGQTLNLNGGMYFG